MRVNLLEEAIFYYSKAKETYEGLNDAKSKGSHKHVVIVQLLSEAYNAKGMHKEALVTFGEILKNPIYKESLLSFTLIEKFEFNLKLTDLFERNKMIEDAASSAEIAYMLLKDNPAIEKDINHELEILNRLIYF
jgi:hypothetical protein